MHIVSNVLKQPATHPLLNNRGEVVAYFKKNLSPSQSIYLENILNQEILLDIKKGQDSLTTVLLMPKEIIELVFNSYNIGELNKISIEEY